MRYMLKPKLRMKETGKFELNIYIEGGYWETIEVYNTFDEITLEQYVKDNLNVY